MKCHTTLSIFPFRLVVFFPLNCSYSKRLNFSSRFHLATFDENLYWQGRFLFTFILLPHDLSSFPSLTLMKDLSREMYSLCVGFSGSFCVATCYDKIIGSSSLYHKKNFFYWVANFLQLFCYSSTVSRRSLTSNILIYSYKALNLSNDSYMYMLKKT